jgi:hypothetical protein
VAAKACILCGTKGPLTREHIWPQWYSSMHPTREYMLESILGTDRPTYRRAASLDLQPRVLCGTCNSHWGKDLEEAVRPRLTGMTRGRSEIITLPFARQLAAWATLKIMAAQHLVRSGDEIAFFGQEEGAALRRRSEPPEGAFIWIGRYVGSRREAGWVLSKQSARRLPEDPTVGAFRHSVMYSIGQVAFQLFGVRLFPLTEEQDSRSIGFYNRFSLMGPWGEALIRIWPLPETRFLWPPSTALDDDGFDAAAARWHDRSPDAASRLGVAQS